MQNDIFKNIGISTDWIVIGLAAVIVVLLIMLICTMVKMSKLKKNYTKFMSGKDGKSLEESILRKFTLLDLLDESVKDIYSKIKEIDANLLLTYQKVGFKKSDAFKEVGGKMSFVLVLLTKENNGIMMNCMHSNTNGCYTYAKRIENGTCKLTLSNEETAALNQALGNSNEE